MESAQQRKAKEKDSGFWNGKRILLISITFIITIGLVVGTITSIAKPNLHGSDIKASMDQNLGLGIGMLIILLIGFAFYFLYRVYPIITRLKKIGIKISFKEYVIYVFSLAFMGAITPGALVNEPYIVFWLKTKGVSTAKASAIVGVNDFMWHIISISIAIPSFIVLCTNQSLMKFLIHDKGGIPIFTLICVGFSLDIVMIMLYFVMGFSRRFHYALSRSFNIVKKGLHLQYHTKQQTAKTYLHDAVLQREAKALLRDGKITVCTLIINGAFQIIMYTALFASVTLLDTTKATLQNYGHVFNVANVVSMANRYLPIPGAEGITQGEIRYMLENLNVYQGTTESVTVNVSNSIFVGRTFTTYIPAVIGLSGFIAFIASCIHKAKHHKKIIKKVKHSL